MLNLRSSKVLVQFYLHDYIYNYILESKQNAT